MVSSVRDLSPKMVQSSLKTLGASRDKSPVALLTMLRDFDNKTQSARRHDSLWMPTSKRISAEASFANAALAAVSSSTDAPLRRHNYRRLSGAQRRRGLSSYRRLSETTTKSALPESTVPISDPIWLTENVVDFQSRLASALLSRRKIKSLDEIDTSMSHSSPIYPSLSPRRSLSAMLRHHSEWAMLARRGNAFQLCSTHVWKQNILL